VGTRSSNDCMRIRGRPATGDLLGAAERGKIGGALPTGWMRPLPDDACGALLSGD